MQCLVTRINKTYFETSGAARPTKQRHISEDLNLQQRLDLFQFTSLHLSLPLVGTVHLFEKKSITNCYSSSNTYTGTSRVTSRARFEHVVVSRKNEIRWNIATPFRSNPSGAK